MYLYFQRTRIDAGSFSLLSALASLFTLASALHVASCNHTTVVSLEELSSLVECVELFALLGLLLVHDSFEGFALPALIDALRPLVSNLTQLVLCVLAVSLRLVLLLGFLAHLCIIRVKCLSVLFVCAIVLSQQLLLGRCVLRLHFEKISF